MSTPKHLIHIGFPKAGSTFLQEWFSKHPKFHFRNAGFGGYHNLYELIRDAARLEINQYDYLVTSSESIATANTYAGIQNTNNGLIHHHIITSKGAEVNLCKTLHSLFPNSKILIITRGFKTVIKSGYAEYIKNGGVKSAEQIQASNLTEIIQLADKLNIPNQEEVFNIILNGDIHIKYDLDKHPQLMQVVNNVYKKFSTFFYDDIISLYQDRFGKEQIIVLPYELLRDNQKEFLNCLQVQLQITPIDIDMGIVNPSLSAQDLYWRRKLSLKVSQIAHLFGKKTYHLLYGMYVQQLRKNTFKWLFSFFKKMFPNKTIESLNIEEQKLELYFKNQATLLKNNPLYQPYAEEYLFSDDEE